MNQPGYNFCSYKTQICFLDCMYGYLLSICQYKMSYTDIQRTFKEVTPYPISIYASQHTSLVRNGVYRKQINSREIIGVFKSCSQHLNDQTMTRFGITQRKWFIFDCNSYALILKTDSNSSSMLTVKKK